MELRQIFLNEVQLIDKIQSIVQQKNYVYVFIIVIMRRVGPLRRRRQSSQKFQPRIIFFDQQQKLQEKCRICDLSQNLISVCECSFKYHEKCLLNYIRIQMKKALSTQLVFNAATIKCPGPNCQKQIFFVHEERFRYGCEFFCQKMKENKCNQQLVLMIILLFILAAFIFVSAYMGMSLNQTASFVLFCVFILLSLITLVSIVLLFFVCLSKYFQIKQIFLKSIVKPKIQREVQGASSSSSDDNKIYENVSQNFQIYVQD